jgi:hypothetical protein
MMIRLVVEKVSVALITVVLAVLINLGASALFERAGIRPEVQPEERLEEQLASIFHALEENSRQATHLLTRLQSEITTRSKAMQGIETRLQELQQQRALLELTPEQRQAIEGLVRRPSSLRDILTSLDFWVGRFALSLGFFVLGLLVSRRGRRRTPDGP